MSPREAALGLQILLGLCALLALFSGPWRKFVMDAARQYLFQLRDRMFIAAADGKIAFDDPAYVDFRGRVNNSIRCFHDYSFFNLISPMSKEDEENARRRNMDRKSLIGNVGDADMRKLLDESHQQIMMVLLVGMVLRSLFASLTLLVALPISGLSYLLDGPTGKSGVVRRAKAAFARFDPIRAD